ncbi:MAG: hypothetical protein R3F48_12615 [Candidatus Zixiibacteriota bacterium]
MSPMKNDNYGQYANSAHLRAEENRQEILQFKVDRMNAVSERLLDYKDMFFDILGFVDYANGLVAERKRLITNFAYNNSLSSEQNFKFIQEITRLGDRVSSGYKYFDMALRQRQIGSYSDLLTGYPRTEIDPGFGLQAALRALGYVCKKTVQNLGREWNGFAVLSYVGKSISAASSIVVLDYGYLKQADSVQDWLVVGHELGHVYFWEEQLEGKLIRPSRDRSYTGTTLLGEIIADNFCLQQSYFMNIKMCLEDFFKSVLVANRRGLRPDRMRQLAYRVFTLWLFGVIYSDRDFTNVVRKYLKLSSVFYWKKTRILKDYLSKIMNASHISNLDPDIFRVQIYDKFIYEIDNRGMYESVNNDLKWLSRAALLLLEASEDVDNISEKRQLKMPKAPEFSLKGYKELAKTVIDGRLITRIIEYPLAFIKVLRETCDENGIDLSDKLFSHVRMAAVMSLANSHLITDSATDSRN